MDRNKQWRFPQITNGRYTFIGGVLLIAVSLSHATHALGQSANEQSPAIDDSRWSKLDGSEPWPTDLIEVTELPAPDETIAKVVKNGNVEFKFYDANKIRRRFTGETRMVMNYYTNVKFRWRVVRNQGKRQLAVTVDHRPTRFEFFHQILLPRAHANEQMFAVPLVLHELDHVRVSLDPRYQAQFEEWFQEATKSLTIEIDSRTKEDDFESLIHAEVQAQSAQCFEKVLQLIHIRNRELDRQTQHGELKLADDFFSVADEN